MNGSGRFAKNVVAAVIGAIGTLLFALPPSAQAAGFYISEIGTPFSLGTAGAANVTNTFGPDAAWSNPAGLVHVESGVMFAGLQVIAPTAKFSVDVAEKGGREGGNAGDPALVPSFYYSQALSEKWHFGFGFSALQGGGADYGDDFAGRYGTSYIILTGIGATWSLGYRVNDRLSVGFGASVIQATYEQDIALNLGPLPDGKVKITDADDVGVQPIVGLQYALTDSLLLGITYRAEFDADLSGNIRFKNVPDILPLPSKTNLDLKWDNPQWLEAGLRWQMGGGKVLFFSGNWQQWSEFSDNQLVIDTDAGNQPVTLDRDWDDTWSVALGFGNVDYYAGWTVGVGYESSPADDDVRTIDFPVDENWKFSAAYGRKRPSGKAWSLGATLKVFGDAKVDQTAQRVRFSGEFDDFYVLYVGATVRF